MGEVRLQPHTLEVTEVVMSGEKPLLDPSSTVNGANMLKGDFEYLLNLPTFPYTLDSMKSITLRITFTPKAAGLIDDSLVITTKEGATYNPATPYDERASSEFDGGLRFRAASDGLRVVRRE